MDEKVGGQEIGTSRVSGLFAQEMLKLFFNLFGGRHAIGVTLCERVESCNVGFAKTSSDCGSSSG
jgi:hypothetical protein